MATTMSMAESSVQVGIPPEKAREKWNAWTKEGGPGMGIKFEGKSQDVPAAKLPAELQKAEAGTAYFEPGSKGGTEVRMQLRYNREGLEKAGQGPDWVEQRINLYLTRFKNFAEGRPA
ncbi:MAG: hypothetical protein E6H93_06625 [Chloroflexi bacterium]|nr:MAG: hypothetical protein E6H93_06625 [Chloroflexota bacterium]